MSTDTSRAGVQRHRSAMRRQWRWYLTGLAATLVVVGVVVGVVWTTGDVANASLRTARTAAPALGVDTAAAHPAPAWHSTDTAALGAPFTGGTVVTYSRHTVTGRDARTGAADWAYTRNNVAVCAVAQLQGKTLALYDSHCDQVSAFDSGTGKRAWVRTLDENAMTIHGRPQVIADTDTLFVWTGSVIYAVDPTGGLDRWTLQPSAGCTFTAVVPGSSGVLLAEHCASGDQLVLRDRYAGYDEHGATEDKKQQIIWRVPAAGVLPVTAGSFVGGYDAARHQLVDFDARSGKVTGRVALTPAPAAGAPVASAALQGGEVVWIAGQAYVVSGGGSAVLWNRAASVVPAVAAGTTGLTVPGVDNGRLLVATGTAIDVLAASNGRQVASYPVPAPPASRLYRAGTGFLVAADGSTGMYL